MSGQSCMTDQNSKIRLFRFYLDHWHGLRRSLAGRLGSQDLADEAMQETWIRLEGLKTAPSSVNNPRGYLLSIAGNIAIDLIRREKRHSDRAAIGDIDIDTLMDDVPSAEEVMLAREELKQLVRALLKLKDKPRRALLMNRCLGMGHREIALALGVSESMVAKYMAQALRHCRDYLHHTQ